MTYIQSNRVLIWFVFHCVGERFTDMPRRARRTKVDKSDEDISVSKYVCNSGC